MIQVVTALAFNGFREARRNRVTLVAGFFALALILSAVLVMEVTVATLERVVVDIGLGSMALILVLLTVFLSCGLLSREIERRTIFLMVSKPISRPVFLVGRYAGNLVTLLALLVLMGAVFVGELLVLGFPLRSVELIAMGMLFFELLILASFGFLMSSFSSPLVSSAVTLGIFIAGHLSADIYKVASKSKVDLVQWIGKATYYLLPNLERFNFRSHATYNLEFPLAPLAGSIAYGLCYTAIVLTLASAVFSRRDFK
jgi:Cu-processing system permease protein